MARVCRAPKSLHQEFRVCRVLRIDDDVELKTAQYFITTKREQNVQNLEDFTQRLFKLISGYMLYCVATKAVVGTLFIQSLFPFPPPCDGLLCVPPGDKRTPDS